MQSRPATASSETPDVFLFRETWYIVAMSARTEQLLEEIKKVEAAIAEVSNSATKETLKEHLVKLQKELTAANADLTEGKQVLKG